MSFFLYSYGKQTTAQRESFISIWHTTSSEHSSFHSSGVANSYFKDKKLMSISLRLSVPQKL